MIHDMPKDKKHRLWILDDLMAQCSDSQDVVDIFTKYSHHLNYSIVLLTQNMYHNGKHFRTISLNTQYLWILKSVRDTSTIATLGRQMGITNLLKEAYQDAVFVPYGHLFIDMKPGSDDRYRIRSNTFGEPISVYLKKQ